MVCCDCSVCLSVLSFFFFFNDTATTEIYTLSLHDALPISARDAAPHSCRGPLVAAAPGLTRGETGSGSWLCRRGCIRAVDRKSTRLNSSHANISYAVFCLKKKKKTLDA